MCGAAGGRGAGRPPICPSPSVQPGIHWFYLASAPIIVERRRRGEGRPRAIRPRPVVERGAAPSGAAPRSLWAYRIGDRGHEIPRGRDRDVEGARGLPRAGRTQNKTVDLSADGGRTGPGVTTAGRESQRARRRGSQARRHRRACRHLLVVDIRDGDLDRQRARELEGGRRAGREIRRAARHDDDVGGVNGNRTARRRAERPLTERALNEAVRAVALAVGIEVDERLTGVEERRAYRVVHLVLVEERLRGVEPRLRLTAIRAAGEIVVRVVRIPGDGVLGGVEHPAARRVLEALLTN